MRRIILTGFFGLFLIFLGCAGPFTAGRPLVETEPQTLVRKIHAHASKLNTLQGSARISVNSHMGNFQGSMKIKARLPDSLYAKVEGPFGVDVALMRLYDADLLFYSPIQHVVYTGSVNDSALGLLPFDITMRDFMLHSLGLLMIPENRLSDIELLYSRNGQYVVNFSNGEKVWVHPKGPVITRWEKKDIQGNLIWTWEGKQFKKSNGVRLPQTINITVEDPKQRVTVYYIKRQTNKNLKSGWSYFKLPEGVESFAL